MKTLRLETTAPFQGLAELVAYDEGLFEKEGLKIEWADREKGVDKTPQLQCHRRHRQGRQPLTPATASCSRRARPISTTPANGATTRRVESTKVGSRQIGRRSIVTFAALVVRGDSPVQTPQQFAGRQIGVPFFFGTHYLTLQMLEGFVPRDQIKLGRVPNGSPYRFKLLMTGQIDATTLTEPYISLAEKKGCRLIISAFHHGTEVASDRVDAETYSAFNRAVREAVRRINANKRAYCTISSTTTRRRTRRSPSSRSTTCAKAASTSSIRRRFRRPNCSAPTTGCAAGVSWMKHRKRSTSSTRTCSSTAIPAASPRRRSKTGDTSIPARHARPRAASSRASARLHCGRA